MQFEQLTFSELDIFLLDIAFLNNSSSFFNLFNCSNQVKPDSSSRDFSVEQSRFLKKSVEQSRFEQMDFEQFTLTQIRLMYEISLEAIPIFG